MRLLPYGRTALLVELDGLRDVLALHAALDQSRPQAPGRSVVDLVPAERTLLVRFDPARVGVEDVRDWVTSATPVRGDDVTGAAVTIPVAYDGPDLEETARLLGWSRAELVEAHTSCLWRSGFIGFAPGFGYLVPDRSWPSVPRRSEPRTRVPAGSVAVAGGYSGVYPRASPGGWQLLGRTDLEVWDVRRDPPALLAPGTTVRFVAAP